jgi:hypothetical protein
MPKQFYQMIDIINEPGCPNSYMFKELFEDKNETSALLENLYKVTIEKLSKLFKGNDPLYLVEPFDVDSSQMLKKCIGLNKLHLPEKLQQKIVFAPHIYQPVKHCNLKSITKNHLQT